MAMFNMYKNFEYLCPDAPDTISQLLLTGEYPLVRPRTVLGTIATHCSRGAGARTLHTSTRPWRCWLPCTRIGLACAESDTSTQRNAFLLLSASSQRDKIHVDLF